MKPIITFLPAVALAEAGLSAKIFLHTEILSKLRTAIGLFFILSFSNVSAQNRLYVNASATGSNNGQSWADAYQDLKLALDAAESGDSVWVSIGTYIPTTGSDRTTSFVQKSGVRLYGGFAGIETDLGQRDWFANPTVLSGDIGIFGDSTDNAYTILYMNNPDSMTVLDGFVFRHGIANYMPTDQPAISPYKCGGALYIMATDGWAYPLIKNCHFEHNYAYSHGGAVYVNGSGTGSVAPQFINCSFKHNHARLDGGALYRNGGSWAERSPDFGNCLFRDNVAERRGGGLCYNESERTDWIDLHDCTFLSNHSMVSGGGANFNVGRVTGTNISMKGCRFEGNANDINTTSGEALALASLNLLDMGTIIIDSCFFKGNDPGILIWGDVLYGEFRLLRSSIESAGTASIYTSAFTRSVVSGCEIEIRVLSIGNSTNISNNIFLQEVSGTFCSITSITDTINFCNNVIFHQKKTNLTFSLQFFGTDKIIEINSNTIVGSKTLLSAAYKAKVNFANCILNDWENISWNDDLHVTFDNCLLKNSSFCQSPPPYATCGPNNLFNLDPLFRDTANHDYSLLPCSPLINAGSNAAAAGILTDLAGNPRIQGGTVDIGAYEAPAFALAAIPEVHPACAGASNGSISLSPVFGCEPYSYNWLPAAGNGPELNGLPPGNYLLTITDGSGRQILDTVQVGAVTVPILNPVATDVQCGTTLGGSIAANVSSGTAPYHYQWLPIATDTSLLTHLPQGAYSITVADANGCLDSASASIALLGMITLMVDGQGISCHGETDGWLSATPVTGTSPFSWGWQGWPGTDSIAQPLGPSTYAVTVSDVYGCTAAFAFPPMAQPDSLWVTVGTSPQKDLLMPDGAAVVTTISGGTSPFGFDWNTGSTQQAIAGLTAGNYTVTVTDKNGCEAVVEVVVDSMVSATEEATGRALLMYPNPAVEWVKVVLPAHLSGHGGQAGERVVELCDEAGRVLRSGALSEGSTCTLNLSGLPSGNYLVRVRNGTGKEMFVGKVMKL